MSFLAPEHAGLNLAHPNNTILGIFQFCFCYRVMVPFVLLFITIGNRGRNSGRTSVIFPCISSDCPSSSVLGQSLSRHFIVAVLARWCQFPVTGALWQHHSLHWYTLLYKRMVAYKPGSNVNCETSAKPQANWHHTSIKTKGGTYIGAVHIAVTGLKILDRPKLSLDQLTTPDLCPWPFDPSVMHMRNQLIDVILSIHSAV